MTVTESIGQTLQTRRIPAALVAMALISAAATAASADDQDCRLKQVADLDIAIAGDETPTVPVTIAGKEYTFKLSLSNQHSALTRKISEALNLSADRLEFGFVIGYQNQQVDRSVTIPDLRVGNVHGGKRELLLLPEPLKSGADGVLGIDVLSNLDAELDFSARKLRLFSQKHCPGKVVYWGRPYDVLAFQKDPLLNPSFNMTLDGQIVRVAFNLDQPAGEMGLLDAGDLFHFKDDDRRLAAVDSPGSSGKRYRFPFETLSLGGLAIGKPDIALYPQTKAEQCSDKLHYDNDRPYRCFTAGILTLGRAEISALHMYFAFGERQLYVTAADPHK